ncbi:MFS transporter [Paenibacillus sp. NFR01]|uniref:MFS transporter n=1 Tax=Paenibacillus sp. NFR01 TaxID=1566279 RepID=UPI0008C2044C|nr:MFS transporter [Paenibacillus sp. NFR01]SET02883.1 Predicted arabinose efflux permease, MFS family [Paenibacillus sp. NFR01]
MSKKNLLLVLILTAGVFGIINTEMGVIGILPALAERYQNSVSQAGLLVSGFALAVAVAGPTMPLLFSGMNRKKVMLLVQSVFLLGNLVTVITDDFTLSLVARIIPALFHPIYCSMAFSLAAASVGKEQAPKAVSLVFVGVSAGMVVGVPIASFLAASVSVEAALIFFAMIHAVVLIATILFVPSLPVHERLAYGTQIRVLRKSLTWLSIATVIFLNASVFGVYSYLAEYLGKVTNLPANDIGFGLILFGVANIAGNVIGGRLLTRNAWRAIRMLPYSLGVVYILLFTYGQFSVPMLLLTAGWGVIAGIVGKFNQYLVMSAAPEAPDFANGLFLTAANIGTTAGAAVGGAIISGWGVSYVVWTGILALALSVVTLSLRDSASSIPKPQ